MRKIIVYNVISLDGYHTGSGNDVSVMFPMMGNVFDSYNAELLRTADVHLMGRVSFELFQSFWPKVAENPTSDEWTDSQRDLSQAGKSVKGNLVLGQGVPVFVGKTPTSLRLIDTRRWEDSDNVLLRYEVPHKSVESPA